MTLLDFRKPKCVVLDKCTSWSGKYWLYYGHHYVAGHLCYDVGVRDNGSGLITTRHYHEKSYPNPKAEALAFWHEFKQKMVKAPESEEKDDAQIDISKFIN
jgi:hypothetical protein